MTQLEDARNARTPTSHQKRVKTIEDKYGKDYWSKVGKLGGRVKNPNKGFGSFTRERLLEVSKKNSRSKKNEVN